MCNTIQRYYNYKNRVFSQAMMSSFGAEGNQQSFSFTEIVFVLFWQMKEAVGLQHPAIIRSSSLN